MTEEARWIPTVVVKFGGQREIRQARFTDRPWTTWLSSKRSTHDGTEVPEVAPGRRPSHPARHRSGGSSKGAASRVLRGR
jgi:hypothetical protein